MVPRSEVHQVLRNSTDAEELKAAASDLWEVIGLSTEDIPLLIPLHSHGDATVRYEAMYALATEIDGKYAIGLGGVDLTPEIAVALAIAAADNDVLTIYMCEGSLYRLREAGFSSAGRLLVLLRGNPAWMKRFY